MLGKAGKVIKSILTGGDSLLDYFTWSQIAATRQQLLRSISAHYQINSGKPSRTKSAVFNIVQGGRGGQQIMLQIL